MESLGEIHDYQVCLHTSAPGVGQRVIKGYELGLTTAILSEAVL